MKHGVSIEVLYHFRCHNCGMWWTAEMELLSKALKEPKVACTVCGTAAHWQVITDAETDGEGLRGDTTTESG